MKKILFILCTTLAVASCSTKQTKPKETAHDFAADDSTLYLTVIYKAKAADSMNVKKLSALPPVEKTVNNNPKPFTGNSIEFSLNVLADKSGYMAQRKLSESTSDTTKSGMEYIAFDWCSGDPKVFKTSEEFVSFITEHGYKLASQTETANYGKDYIFSRI